MDQINNNTIYASEFYPENEPNLQIIVLKNSFDQFDQDDIWVLGVRDINSDYYLYMSDEIFSSSDNRLFQNGGLIPHYFDIYIQDNSSGENLIGVSIYDQKTYKGTASNQYGFYSLSIKRVCF